MSVLVRYFAAAREAAGTAEEDLDGADVRAVLVAAVALHGAQLGDVLQRCSYLVDGLRATTDTTTAGAVTLDVLPPFAGG